MFLITEDMLFFPLQHRTSTCPLGWELNTLILVSFTFEKSSILQCRRLLPVAITNKNIIYLSVPELENSVFLDLVLLSCTPVATNSFSCSSLQSSYTATLSSTCFWLFLPSGMQSSEEPTLEGNAWTGSLNLSSLSLFSFSELNKALDTSENNWGRVFIFLPQEQYKLGPTYPRLAIFSLRELNQTSSHVCFEGWNKLSLPMWSPWEPNLTRWQRRSQLGLLSINFVFRKVIFQPMVFPFVWAKYGWNFERDRCKLSFPRETRFTRPNTGACSQARTTTTVKHATAQDQNHVTVHFSRVVLRLWWVVELFRVVGTTANILLVFCRLGNSRISSFS